jgi:prepilin-type N-terminal cleavage/methylation domain-containing protein
VKKTAGFTLIEVLVSVVILSAGIVFVLQAFETATVALSEMRDTIWAGNAAQSEFDRLRVMGYAGIDIGDGYWSGRYRAYYSDFVWERRVSDAGLADNAGGDAPDVRSVVLLVKRDGSSRLFRYETYIRVAEKAAVEDTP